MSETLKEVAVSNSVALAKRAGMSVSAFSQFVQGLGLLPSQIGLLVEMRETYQLSLNYVGKILRNGIALPYINAAYLLSKELPPLYDPNASRGRIASEFALPVEKACQLLARIYREDECDDEESIEATIRLLSEVADRCPQIQTWSTIIEVLVEVMDPLSTAIAERTGDLLDIPPPEKVEMMIVLIDELRLISDGRL